MPFSFNPQAIANSLSLIAVASLFGGMVFFPSVVAPTVFKALEPEDAGKFLRRLFPAYYAFIIAASVAAALLFVVKPLIAIGFLIIGASTYGVRQFLVPKINAWRDQELAGDEAAGKKFAMGHKISVLINMCQLLFVFFALVTLWP
ncbi:MAG: DUF4149 domain-containing protein [Pseudomonadota bacterium]